MNVSTTGELWAADYKLQCWYWIRAHPWTTAVVVLLANIIFTRYRSGLRQIPGPLLASFSNLWKLQAVWSQNMHIENIRLHEDYGPIVRIGPNHVSVSDPQSMRAIYGVQNVFPKTAFYSLAESIFDGRFLPNMFTTQSNQYHMHLKRGAASAFSMDVVVSLEGFADKCISILLARLREISSSGNKPINPVDWMQYFAFDVLGEISFSKDLGFLEKGADVDGMIAAIDGVGQVPFLHKFLLGNPLLPKLFPAIEKTDRVLQFSLDRIKERQENPVERKDILSQLLRTHAEDPNSLSMAEVIAITTTNVLAGSDTTAISLSSALYYLSKYPETRRKLEKEIEAAITEGRASNPITYAEAVKLPYLSAVINEAMRIHPATGFILERCVPKTGVTLHGVYLPENTIVGVNSWALHYNKDVFGPDVHAFRPERWIEGDEDRIKDMRRNMIAFGYGPRSCIGKNVSMLEMWKVLFELYRNFEITLADDQDWSVKGHWFTWQSNVALVFRPKL
ncbi:Pisatin demethylase [Cytospora mali]|uniref:Pisatin demethylase n=1 Tax=Cytospora mali TaxID=578113 RepID=A0A194VP71_CYTMA|nr:Pisatin demethylase [Valsa mali]